MRRQSLGGVRESYRGRHVRVFRLDRAGVLERLRRSADRLLRERPEIVAVWLFGSLARNEALPGSDADLLIVVRDGAGPFLERSDTVAPYFAGSGVGCDVLVYTQSEVDRLSEARRSLVGTALREGVLLARRDA